MKCMRAQTCGKVVWDLHSKPRLRTFVRAENQSRSLAGPTQILKIPPLALEEGGLLFSAQPEAGQQNFRAMMQTAYVKVNLDYPGLRILNIDPPVLSVPGFLPSDMCINIMSASTRSGKIVQSRIGGMSSTSQAVGTPSAQDIRTSSTFAMNSASLKEHPELAMLLEEVLLRADALMDTEIMRAKQGSDLAFTAPDQPGEKKFELPQVAYYQTGQQFMTHEDAFPSAVALKKRYQRCATLLVYLNDVQEGGATYFNALNMGVQPRRGSALLFFPAFVSGRPDARTVHAALPAGPMDKWVLQLWLSVGLAGPAARPPAMPVVAGWAGTGRAGPKGPSGAAANRRKRK